MIPKKQTRLHKGLLPISDRGNCFPACIASILEMEVEEVIQIQEYYDDADWSVQLGQWLFDNGYIWRNPTEGEDMTDKYVLVTGKSPRHPDLTHVVIYQNGKMVHDPHPDNTFLEKVEAYELLIPLKAPYLNNYLTAARRAAGVEGE